MSKIVNGFTVKKIMLVTIMLSMFGSLVACSGEIPVTDLGEPATEEPYRPTLSPKPDWLIRWLNEPVCKPPCWENIIPGNTSFADAQAIANALSGADVYYVDDNSISLSSNQYNTNFALLLSRGDANIQVVALITRYTSLELSEIVDLYGFPDEMLSFDFFDNPAIRSIDLLYYDLGMVITFDRLPSDPGNKVSLDPNIFIKGITFYAPRMEYYFDSSRWGGFVVSPPIKLNGYGDYDIPEGICYC